MTIGYVFVEGPTDAELLHRIVPPEAIQDVKLIITGGRVGMASYARSVRVHDRVPVLVLRDADSLNRETVESQRQDSEDLIRMVAPSAPVKVISVVPEIEAWLFAAPEAIERVLGEKLTEERIALGKRDPKGVLQYLANLRNATWNTSRAVAALDDHDVERIRELPEVQEMILFLHEMQSVYQAA